MKYFRLYEDLDGHEPLGYGPKGGRWNNNNIPVIYCCNTRSLTMFETYCIAGPAVANGKFILAEIEIKAPLPSVVIEDLPENWRLRPHLRGTKELGSFWANNKQSLCLRVPSARLPISCFPDEHNLLINPFHPDFIKSLKVLNMEKVQFAINEIKST